MAKEQGEGFANTKLYIYIVHIYCTCLNLSKWTKESNGRDGPTGKVALFN